MTDLLLVLSVGVAVVPMVGFLAVIWWLDRYDREPVWLIALTFAWGAIGAVGLSIALGTSSIFLFEHWFSSENVAALYTMLLAPLTEEPMKAVVLLAVARSRHFDNATDGFVYGAAAGLGFGMTENFMYFTATSMIGDPLEWCCIVAVRTCFSAVMHATATSIVGAMIGWSRFRRWKGKVLALMVGMGLAIAIHGFWNSLVAAGPFLALTQGASILAPMSILLAMLGFAVQFGMVFTVFLVCVGNERHDLQRELSAEVDLGTLPAHHVPILCSYVRRRRTGWLPEGADYASYVRAATTLAFRRKQTRLSPDADPYTAEIQALRTALTRELEPIWVEE